MAKLSNPLGFTRGPVTIITILIYIAVLTAVIVTQTRVPPAPESATPIRGINLTEAWDDLQILSAQFHPYNSHQNDDVHGWLLRRISSILRDNKASNTSAYVFEDNNSNLTFSSGGSAVTSSGISVYFEGTNIIIYVRGSEDDQNEWWTQPKANPSSRNGVLVNAHYDSVATGFGATDDGVGVVSILQLLRYYTTKGNSPKNGLVLLLNNGEEDFLNGASVFSQHPLSRFPSSFLNLEGAGAGGRAALFRSTDEEVTEAYRKSPYPFGTVVFGDGFQSGLIRSQTDYVVFNGKLGLRGLDVAFIAPRARYHTDQDDSRHTGKNALWHMLSAAIATTRELTKNSPSIDQESLETAMSNTDVSESAVKQPGHRAVWFDLFGEVFIVMQAHTFFALSITVLVVGPVLLLLTMITLYRSDKLYMFSSSRRYHTIDGDEYLPLGGWRGLFRTPIILVFACAAPIALAYLLFKENPFITHSSEWAVWCMMISSFLVIAWFLGRAIDFVRPSALTRAYGFSWLCGAWWVFLVAATVFEEQFHLGGGYFALFYSGALFLATWLSYIELFSTPKKAKYCSSKVGEEYPEARSRSVSRPPTRGRDDTEAEASDANVEPEADETSSLLRGGSRSAFKNYSRSIEPREPPEASGEDNSHHEQEWSKPMWTWMWVLEFLIIIPFNVILLGQFGVNLVTSLGQTGADGSSMFIVYIAMAVLTIFMFSPLVPMLHRFSWPVPAFLFLVLVGTLVYNLLAFPFSSQNRLKLFFQQQVDLDHGNNTVSLIGVPGFVQDAISSIPSAAGQDIVCHSIMGSDRLQCSWTGPAANIAGQAPLAALKGTNKWVNYNVTLTNNGSETNTAQFVVYGRNTRACKLVFDTPISDFHVSGQGPYDKRFPAVPEGGSKEIRLWSRTWDRPWTVDVTWSVENGVDRSLTGKVICLWSDANQNGVIPALDEVKHYVPDWVAVTKAGDGLVEGFKRFQT